MQSCNSYNHSIEILGLFFQYCILLRNALTIIVLFPLSLYSNADLIEDNKDEKITPFSCTVF
jgi:hypothetical protein